VPLGADVFDDLSVLEPLRLRFIEAEEWPNSVLVDIFSPDGEQMGITTSH
jgi:hypothetical protein